MKLAYKIGKIILNLIVLLCLFADAANVLDLFTESTVIHFEGDSPDPGDELINAPSAGLNLSSEMTLPRTPEKPGSHKDVIFDQDSPSIIHDTGVDFIRIVSVNKPKNSTATNLSKTKNIYIENCQLQI